MTQTSNIIGKAKVEIFDITACSFELLHEASHIFGEAPGCANATKDRETFNHYFLERYILVQSRKASAFAPA